MCGIVYVKRLDHAKAQKQVLKRYSKQQHRGNEGYGYVGVKSNGAISPLQRTQFEHEIRTKLVASSLTEILFHHRYPTSTPNVPEAAHPLFVAHKELQYNYYVVHNGVLHNEEDLKDIHVGLGYRYLTEVKTQFRTKKGHVYTEGVVFNDSEAFAIELARTIEGLQPECNARGAIAYMAYQVDKVSGKVMGLFFGTNGGNPLMVQRTKEYICIASEGGGNKLEANKSYRLDPITSEVTEADIKLQPIYVAPAVGYHRVEYTSNPSNPGSRSIDRVFPETERLPWNPDTQRKYIRDEDMSLGELELEIADTDDEIIGVSGDILYAQNEDDLEEAAAFEQDYLNLLERRKKLEKLYEQKALTAK